MTPSLFLIVLAGAMAKNALQVQRAVPSLTLDSQPDFERIAIYVLYLLAWGFAAVGVWTGQAAQPWATGVLLVGVVLSVSGILSLGANYSEYISPVHGGRLVTRGAFAILRHPMRVGLFLEVLGLFLLTGSIEAGILLILIALLLWRRSVREERLLRIAYGPEFETYCERVGAIFPIPASSVVKLGNSKSDA